MCRSVGYMCHEVMIAATTTIAANVSSPSKRPLGGEGSDPARVIATVGEQHCSRFQAGQEFECEPAVMRFSGRKREPDRQAVSIDHRMLVKPPRDRPMDCLLLRAIQAAC
jgi:hypothetical protein